jgi:uncharacterized protein YdeI (YjbR/CyaY-like superfamily)
MRLRHQRRPMNSNAQRTRDEPELLFRDRGAWEAWLDKNHATSSGLWLRLARKASGRKSVSYEEALDVALCYGWIDSQGKSEDESYRLQKFTPRAKRSIWSKRNREKALALIKNGQMRPAGLAEVQRAKKDGRWSAAYDSPSRMTVPRDFQAALNRTAQAKAFFKTLDSRNRYAILFRLQTAKRAETRMTRIERFVEMLAKNEKLYP